MDKADGYAKFAAKVKRNPNMYELPLSSELEAIGYSIDNKGYIIGPSGQSWNTGVVNPEILPDPLRKLFGEPTPPPSNVPDLRPETLRDVEPTIGESPKVQENQEGAKACSHCGETRPLEQFRRVRGGKRLDKCNVCIGQAIKEAREKKRVEDKETTPPVSASAQSPTGWISVEQAKVHVRDAYSRGYADGQKDAEPDEVNVTLDDLLEVEDE